MQCLLLGTSSASRMCGPRSPSWPLSCFSTASFWRLPPSSLLTRPGPNPSLASLSLSHPLDHSLPQLLPHPPLFLGPFRGEREPRNGVTIVGLLFQLCPHPPRACRGCSRAENIRSTLVLLWQGPPGFLSLAWQALPTPKTISSPWAPMSE